MGEKNFLRKLRSLRAEDMFGEGIGPRPRQATLGIIKEADDVFSEEVNITVNGSDLVQSF